MNLSSMFADNIVRRGMKNMARRFYRFNAESSLPADPRPNELGFNRFKW